jgi:hypothetical protein
MGDQVVAENKVQPPKSQRTYYEMAVDYFLGTRKVIEQTPAAKVLDDDENIDVSSSCNFSS